MTPLSLAAHSKARWITHTGVPADWQQHLERLGGGYFHSPVGLDTVSAPGQALFFEWCDEARTIGVAAGLRHPCRLSGAPVHVYLPTLPVVEHPWKREAALRSLIAWLGAQHMAELVCDSFHADGIPPLDTAPVELHRRFEYVMPLDAPPKVLFSRWAHGLRAQLEAAQGAGWALAMPTGHDVCDVAAAVGRDAAPACPHPDNGPIMGAPDIDLALGTTDLTEPWGRAVFVALDDGQPLALAVVGWANRRAYHLLDMVTHAGRERPAMTWLYAQIVNVLCDHGFQAYHLGGAPASVADPHDDVYAFHQSRLGLGGVPVFNACARWVLDSSHAVRHRTAAADRREALAV